MSGFQNTIEVMKDIMNSSCDFLTITLESVDDFIGVSPTLDLSIWVREDNKTMYKFFQKPIASNMVLQRQKKEERRKKKC